jgi:hypothetical protein
LEGMMLSGDACVHQGYERHSPSNIFSLKRYWVRMMLAGNACVNQGYERHSPPNIIPLK